MSEVETTLEALEAAMKLIENLRVERDDAMKLCTQRGMEMDCVNGRADGLAVAIARVRKERDEAIAESARRNKHYLDAMDALRVVESERNQLRAFRDAAVPAMQAMRRGINVREIESTPSHCSEHGPLIKEWYAGSWLKPIVQAFDAALALAGGEEREPS